MYAYVVALNIKENDIGPQRLGISERFLESLNVANSNE
jgi:hypothetical protein